MPPPSPHVIARRTRRPEEDPSPPAAAKRLETARETLFVTSDEATQTHVVRLDVGGEGKTGTHLCLYESDSPEYGATTPNPGMDAFMAVICLRPFEKANYNVLNGRHRLIHYPSSREMECLFDLRNSWRAELVEPFKTINFFVTADYLKDIAGREGHLSLDTFSGGPMCQVIDYTMRHLALTLLPSLENPGGKQRQLFIDHVTAAMAHHIGAAYGLIRPYERLAGGLGAWQEKRAKEFLVAHIDSDVALTDVAAACGLSLQHFTRAFRQSTGTTPYRWLLDQRLDRAKTLLAGSDDRLSDIALACGFADQSHFTRSFSAAFGVSPGVWRRSCEG